MRDGARTSVSYRDVVVGDILFLAVGDIPCADGVLLDGADVKLDESSLTGESILIKKNLQKPFIWSGTRVMEGFGR